MGKTHYVWGYGSAGCYFEASGVAWHSDNAIEQAAEFGELNKEETAELEETGRFAREGWVLYRLVVSDCNCNVPWEHEDGMLMNVTIYGDGLFTENSHVAVFLDEGHLHLCDYSEYGMHAASCMVRNRQGERLDDLRFPAALALAMSAPVRWLGSGYTPGKEYGGDFAWNIQANPGAPGMGEVLASDILEALEAQ